jgi:hypothetical protein
MQVALKFGLKGCEAKQLRNVEVGSLLTHESEDVFFYICLRRPRDFRTLCCRSGRHVQMNVSVEI